MTERRAGTGLRPARERWSFADDEIAREERIADAAPPPQAPIPQFHTPPSPAKRDFLFEPPEETAAPIATPQTAAPAQSLPGHSLPPRAPIPTPPREAPRQAFAPPPSHWARIEVPEADRARAAAAGLERYTGGAAAPRSRSSRPASWLAVVAILLVAGIAAVALYRFADPLASPQGPAAPQNATAPNAGERAMSPPPAGFEPIAPPRQSSLGQNSPDQPSAAQAPPKQPSSSQPAPARDTPLIEVAP